MSGWIGVDLDSTLAHYEGWNGGAIGEPIQPMVERIRHWLAEGVEVRIFTARVSHPSKTQNYHTTVAIQEWLERKCGLPALQVTCVKDFGMIELWDDRCVQVQPNTGQRVQDFWNHRLETVDDGRPGNE